MKLINKILQILAVVFGVGTVVLFFAPFANITTATETITPVAAQLAFGGKVAGFNLSMSAHILFVFCLSVIATIMSGFAFKSKGLRYSASAVSLISAVYMWVIALSDALRFVDAQQVAGVKEVTHTSFVLILAIVSTLFAVFAIAYLIIDDYIVAKETNGKTIWKKISLFFRDNKSEIKKIVWPGLRDVIKNTLTVLVMCLIIGALIWAIDFGLGRLLELILGAK